MECEYSAKDLAKEDENMTTISPSLPSSPLSSASSSIPEEVAVAVGQEDTKMKDDENNNNHN